MALRGTIIIDCRETIKLGMLKTHKKASGENHYTTMFYPAGQGDFDEIGTIIKGGINIGPTAHQDNIVTFECPGFGELPGVPQRLCIIYKDTDGRSFLLEKLLGKDNMFLIKENERLRQEVERLELALGSKETERQMQQTSIDKQVAKRTEATKKSGGFNPLDPLGRFGGGGGFGAPPEDFE